MKTLTNITLWVLFFGLMIGNIVVFISGVQLSEDIHSYELEIEKLDEDNALLETKVLQIESMEFAATIAAELDYTKKAEPVSFENENRYAYNQ